MSQDKLQAHLRTQADVIARARNIANAFMTFGKSRVSRRYFERLQESIERMDGALAELIRALEEKRGKVQGR